MDTKKITLKSGVVVELKKTMTGGDFEDIQSAFGSGIKLDTQGQAVKSEIDGSFLKKYRHAQIETLVVSVDGQKDNLIEKVRGLSIAEYNQVIDELENLVNPPEAKKN